MRPPDAETRPRLEGRAPEHIGEDGDSPHDSGDGGQDPDYGLSVFPQHQAKLSSSVVALDVAQERGYVTADTKSQLERYGFSPAQRRVPA